MHRKVNSGAPSKQKQICHIELVNSVLIAVCGEALSWSRLLKRSYYFGEMHFLDSAPPAAAAEAIRHGC